MKKSNLRLLETAEHVCQVLDQLRGDRQVISAALALQLILDTEVPAEGDEELALAVSRFLSSGKRAKLNSQFTEYLCRPLPCCAGCAATAEIAA